METLLLLGAIVFVIALQFSINAEQERIRQMPVYSIGDIRPDMVDENIRSAPKIVVTILRRSGYEYDNCSWEFANVGAALNYAASRFAKARLDGFHIVKNTPKEFRIEAAYDSPGARRTGKYMGGCLIEPVMN